jgi:hypothetical protein
MLVANSEARPRAKVRLRDIEFPLIPWRWRAGLTGFSTDPGFCL